MIQTNSFRIFFILLFAITISHLTSCNNFDVKIGGTIKELTGTVVLQVNNGDALTIKENGTFTFSTIFPNDFPYKVTVLTQPTNQTCSVAHGSGETINSDITNIIVTCSSENYTVGGTVTGLTGTVIIENNAQDDLSINADGTFTFASKVASGSDYAVTILAQPVGETCTLTKGVGIGTTNITNVLITCSTIIHSVGGTVSGLTGTVVLQNNSADNLTINSDGPFTFTIPVAYGATYSVTVLTQPAGSFCIVANNFGLIGDSDVNDVTVTCSPDTTLSVDTTGTIPVNSGNGTITVTNTGTTSIATNVSAILPAGWTNVAQDASDCTSIAPNGGTCTLSFSSTTPYIAQSGITITGDNITSSPTTALAFTVSSYLVYAVSGPNALVIGSSDATGSPKAWSATNNNISGITETSNSPCVGSNDGACDTGQIEAFYTTPYTNYAAGLCYEITSDNSGTVSLGTWYLPAICELGGAGQGAGCSSGIAANIDATLFQLGFGGISGDYWSSTEFSGSPTTAGWLQYFGSNGNSIQIGSSKFIDLNVRCVRSITY